MKCNIVQDRILALEQFAELPAPLQRHLDSCPSCQAWFARVVQLEENIRQLPTPRSDGTARARLIKKIRTPEIVPAPTARPMQPAWSLFTLVERYWHGGLIAATLLIGTVAFLNLGGRSSPLVALPPDPLLNDLVDANVALVEADSPAKRMNQLAQVADKLYIEIREIANVDASGENLSKLSKLYNRIVMEGIVDFAREIPAHQQIEILTPIAGQLSEMSLRADELAKSVQPNAIPSLRDVSFDAREATKKLNTILKGRSS